MTDAFRKIICDAGPLIHLDEIECLQLLDDFTEIVVPQQVWNEVSRHRPAALQNPQAKFLITEVAISQQARFRTLVKSFALDSGEQAALSLMQDNPEAIFLTDDAAARLAAMSLGYRVHGSIGILIRAIRRKQKSRDEVLAILRTLPDLSTLHIRPALLKEIINLVEAHTVD